MTIIIYITIFGLVTYVIIRIIANSTRTKYSPNDEESIARIDSAKKNLKEKWSIEPGNFWIPLDGNISQNSCYFNTNEFNSYFGLDKLSRLINRIEKGQIYSFGESNVFTQIDELNINGYPGLDTYYSNSSGNWVVYITHENTIAFGGFDVINALKTEWSDFDKFMNPWDKKDTDNST